MQSAEACFLSRAVGGGLETGRRWLSQHRGARYSLNHERSQGTNGCPRRQRPTSYGGGGHREGGIQLHVGLDIEFRSWMAAGHEPSRMMPPPTDAWPLAAEQRLERLFGEFGIDPRRDQARAAMTWAVWLTESLYQSDDFLGVDDAKGEATTPWGHRATPVHLGHITWAAVTAMGALDRVAAAFGGCPGSRRS